MAGFGACGRIVCCVSSFASTELMIAGIEAVIVNSGEL